MDKKSKKILMHYMDDTKRKLLSLALLPGADAPKADGL